MLGVCGAPPADWGSALYSLEAATCPATCNCYYNSNQRLNRGVRRAMAAVFGRWHGSLAFGVALLAITLSLTTAAAKEESLGGTDPSRPRRSTSCVQEH